MKKIKILGIFIAGFLVSIHPGFAAPPNSPVSGAIFTTDAGGNPVNQNLYDSKEDVYLNGGPRGGAPEMPNGSYFIQVTDPSGNLLGRAVENYISTQPIEVMNGSFVQLYQVFDVVKKAKSNFNNKGYDDTTNGGGEYKVWICNNSDFNPAGCKTDNFKVRESIVSNQPGGNVEALPPSGGEGTGVVSPGIIVSSPTGENVNLSGSHSSELENLKLKPTTTIKTGTIDGSTPLLIQKSNLQPTSEPLSEGSGGTNTNTGTDPQVRGSGDK
jgi:hypothetical protein